jgi:hypothetical protein
MLALLIACGTHAAPMQSGTLTEGIVARAGSIDITTDLASRVATAQKIDSRSAVTTLADDAVAAQAAQTKSLDVDPTVAWRVRALKARTVTDRFREEARALGPPTDAEISMMSSDHWQEVDTPEQRTAIHAIVLKEKNKPPPPNALDVAESIRHAVGDEGNDQDFESIANKIGARGTTIRVERLPPFVADGRIAQPGAQGSFDATFARTTFAIPAVGRTSDVTETRFGWHVIRLIRITPPHAIPWEERRGLFAEEIFATRAREKHDQLLGKLRAKETIDVSLSAEQSMALVK